MSIRTGRTDENNKPGKIIPFPTDKGTEDEEQLPRPMFFSNTENARMDKTPGSYKYERRPGLWHRLKRMVNM